MADDPQRTDPDAPRIPMPELSREQYDALVQYMETKGKSRAQAQGADFSEADYLAGCMSALFALGSAPPGGWVFGLMAGNSPLGIQHQDPEVYVVREHTSYGRCRATAYERSDDALEHIAFLEHHGRTDCVTGQVRVRRELAPEIAAAIEAESEP